MDLKILHRDDLPLGGFAGLKEHRLVTDPQVFGSHTETGTWSGIGNFVYLADARFNPHGDTRMHSHKEIDVISVMVEGRINHEGSLEHGQQLNAGDVQVQRAGAEGFKHNEVNPDDNENRMLQIWVLPETAGEPADYKLYKPEPENLTRIYGGPTDQGMTFPSKTEVDIVKLNAGQHFDHKGSYMAYLYDGEAKANGEIMLRDGDLFQGVRLQLESITDIQLLMITI